LKASVLEVLGFAAALRASSVPSVASSVSATVYTPWQQRAQQLAANVRLTALKDVSEPR
jgi:hypothetical protein